jgi:hypothetical protein
MDVQVASLVRRFVSESRRAEDLLDPVCSVLLLVGGEDVLGHGVADIGVDVPHPRVTQLLNDDETELLALDPLIGDGPDKYSMSFGTTFARLAADSLPERHRVMLVSVSSPSRLVEGAWHPDASPGAMRGVAYREAVRRVGCALRVGRRDGGEDATCRLAWIVYCHGRSDVHAESGAPMYQACLDALARGLRASVAGAGDQEAEVPAFVVVGMGLPHPRTASAAAIERVHELAPTRMQRCAYVPVAAPASGSSNAWFSGIILRDVGRRALLAAAKCVAEGGSFVGDKSPPGEPTDLSTTWGQTWVRVRWFAAVAGVTNSYQLTLRDVDQVRPCRTTTVDAAGPASKERPESGGRGLLAMPLLEHTFSELNPGRAYDLSVSAVNAAGTSKAVRRTVVTLAVGRTDDECRPKKNTPNHANLQKTLL